MIYALAQAGQHGFDSPRVLGFGLTGIAALTAFTMVELRTPQPMLDVRLLRDKLFGAANFVMLIGTASIMGVFFVLPIFLQTQKGISAFDVGLLTFPMALGVAIMAQPASKLYPKIGPRRMMVAGFAGNLLMTGTLALVNYGTPDLWIAANMFVRGLSFGLMIIPLQAASFATISPEATGRASSIFNVSRQVAGSLGIAVLATILTSRLAAHDAFLADPATTRRSPNGLPGHLHHRCGPDHPGHAGRPAHGRQESPRRHGSQHRGDPQRGRADGDSGGDCRRIGDRVSTVLEARPSSTRKDGPFHVLAFDRPYRKRQDG